MEIEKKSIFVLLFALLIFWGFTFSSAAVEAPDADYERYYPKYVESKEPLSTIKLKDMREFNAAKLFLQAYSISNPVTIRYYINIKHQLDIYAINLIDKLKPVIFFIHSGDEDKRSVLYAFPLGYV
jgi:hypothetical protein